MKILGYAGSEPPPLPGDDALDAFAAARGWTYYAEWVDPWEDDDGVAHEGFWTRAIAREVPIPGGGFVVQHLDLGRETGERGEVVWQRWIDLAEAALERRCADAGVAYDKAAA